MKIFAIVLGIIIIGALGLVVYASQIKPPESEIEVVIPEGDLPG